MPNLEKAARILAYQKSSLLDIQRLYETLRYDLSDYLEQEQHIAEEISILQQGFADLSQRGKMLPVHPLPGFPEKQENIVTSAAAYPRLNIPVMKDLDLLGQQAEKYLRQHGIDPDDDPLPGVLEAQEILDIAEAYRQRYGSIGWDRADYVVVTLAAVVGTLLDLFLLQIPGNPRFLLSLPQGYALTDWIRNNSQRIQEDYLLPVRTLAEHYLRPSIDEQEQVAQFMNQQAAGEQDILLSFLLEILDIVRYSGTFIDQHGNVVGSEHWTTRTEIERTTWFVQRLLRLFSEVFASVGMSPPFRGLLPFMQGDQVSWDAVSAYLHSHDYNVRDFLIMGIVPAAVESIVRGYWLLKHFDAQDHLDRTKVKMTSMLLLSHTISLSGNLMKTGILFQLNPLLLNWDHLLRFVPLMLCWVHEGIEREKFIRAKLDEEWIKLYKRFDRPKG